MLGGMQGRVNERTGVAVFQKSCWRNIAVAPTMGCERNYLISPTIHFLPSLASHSRLAVILAFR
jgi:hypothetical protein